MINFHEEYGYLVKDLSTGEIDTITQYPVTKRYTEQNTLIEGYAWVKVKITYSEAEEK